MTTDTREDGAEGATDTPALVVCDAAWIPHCGSRPHAEDRDCINPRPAATIELPTSSAPQCKAPVFEDGYCVGPCGYPLPCAAHPAPLEGQSPPPTSTPAARVLPAALCLKHDAVLRNEAFFACGCRYFAAGAENSKSSASDGCAAPPNKRPDELPTAETRSDNRSAAPTPRVSPAQEEK